MVLSQAIGRKERILQQWQALRKIQGHRWMRHARGFGVGTEVDRRPLASILVGRGRKTGQASPA